MKKYWDFLIIAVILMLILSGCGRDLSTPSSRLVGHWAADGAIKTEYYYSEIDSRTKVGTLTEYDPRSGTVITCNYGIFNEVPTGENVSLEEAKYRIDSCILVFCKISHCRVTAPPPGNH